MENTQSELSYENITLFHPTWDADNPVRVRTFKTVRRSNLVKMLANNGVEGLLNADAIQAAEDAAMPDLDSIAWEQIDKVELKDNGQYFVSYAGLPLSQQVPSIPSYPAVIVAGQVPLKHRASMCDWDWHCHLRMTTCLRTAISNHL